MKLHLNEVRKCISKYAVVLTMALKGMHIPSFYYNNTEVKEMFVQYFVSCY